MPENNFLFSGIFQKITSYFPEYSGKKLLPKDIFTNKQEAMVFSDLRLASSTYDT